MAVSFELNGQEYSILNGGPMFKLSEAISFQVMCESQEEVDYYWEKLSAGGDAEAQACGWLKDEFGVSWQVITAEFHALLKAGDGEKSKRMMAAMFQMKKLDLNVLKKAYSG